MAPTEAKRGKRARVLDRQAERTRRRDRNQASVAVTFRHMEPTEAIRQYAERRLKHLAKFLGRPCEIHLILEVDKYRHRGEVTFKSVGHTVTAQEETKDLYSVIDLLADKAGAQLKKLQGKTASRRIRAESTGKILSAAETERPA